MINGVSWTANVLTLFPEVFPGTLGASIIGKALKDGRWKLNKVNIRDFSNDRYGHIDASPYGGGEGMIIRPDVISSALDSLIGLNENVPIFCLSPRGKLVNQDLIKEIIAKPNAIFLCGRYEGVDQRVIDSYDMQEISICDSVLAGGEVATMAVIESCVRLLPNVLGNPQSAQSDTFSNYLLEHDQYTFPEKWNCLPVPGVLLTGNHVKIDAFKENKSKNITKTRRPDLWAKYVAQSLQK
ncbi:MAG: tRNA (guanosine(37)-N1)-methyltransferase TrmD [Holosporales bacterium]|jgi:tRNA (guanine37-N1)-methyltransferase|nr:tRNA (guanosine(37)-N1)-methyltransferase TrmD [Holosporales bacterium]